MADDFERDPFDGEVFPEDWRDVPELSDTIISGSFEAFPPIFPDSPEQESLPLRIKEPVAYAPAPSYPPPPVMPPVYDRPRYDIPPNGGDPWQPHPVRTEKKSGWKAGFFCMLFVVFFLTGAVVLSARDNGLWLPAQPAIESRRPPGDRGTPSEPPITDRNPTQPAISGNQPLDASGNTAMEIIDRPGSPAPPADGQPLTIGQIAEKVLPSVVGIEAIDQDGRTISSGSGVVMTADGYVVTNNHVVERCDYITVVLASGDRQHVLQYRTDRNSDLAVLKIDAAGLTPAEFGNSDLMVVGDLAVVIGNPLGLELQSTVTNGIISAINRDIVIEDLRMTMLQTNCAINPGNSGGPLINEYGQVVGIISSKIMSDYFNVVEGLGFAIPSNTVSPIVNELIVRGYVKGRPAIGITGYDISEQTARSQGIQPGFQVETINPQCDAYKQGLRENDIITHVFDERVYGVTDINLIKNDFEVGESMTVTVYRPSEFRSLDITFELMDSGELDG